MNYSTQPLEQRLFNRHPVCYPATFVTSNDAIPGRIANIGLGGIGLQCDTQDLESIRYARIDFGPRYPEIDVEIDVRWQSAVAPNRCLGGAAVIRRDDDAVDVVRTVVDDLHHMSLHSPSGRKRFPRHDQQLTFKENISRKVEWLSHHTGRRFSHFTQYSFQPQRANRNIENMIGVCQIPLGITGPVLINGTHAAGEYFVPMATTEGTLVDTYHYGMMVTHRAGGVNVSLLNDQMDITPVFEAEDLTQARALCRWIERHELQIKKEAERTTQHGRLVHVQTQIIGRRVFVTFFFSTGDAMGLNIANIAAERAARYICEQAGINNYFLRSNLSTDKKPSFVNLFKPYGKELVADITINKRLLRRFFGITPQKLEDFYKSAVLGSQAAGMIGTNAHFANGLAAIFAACGQDIAQVVNASIGITQIEVTGDGDAYMSIRAPNIIVATVGGGTELATQRECLEIMGCYGSGKVHKFAEIIAGTLLAGELTISAALASGRFVEAHANKRKLPR